MATKFLSSDAQFRAGVNMREEPVEEQPTLLVETPQVAVEAKAVPRASEYAAIQNQEDAPPCSTCGSLMIRSGSCYKCPNCGTTSGCA